MKIDDPPYDHTGVQASPSVGTIVRADHASPWEVLAPVQIVIAPTHSASFSVTHTVTVQYIAAVQTITVVYDGTAVYDHVNIGTSFSGLNLNAAHVGFTSSTGFDTEAVSITQMTFSIP